ncbi:MAG: hypothetical protein F6K65_28235 [Moorea sp. SIO3C2]|nr:hypothetical protein [Moorena sp. SIO3C2]
MGMLVERASCWNGDVGGTGILPVINIFGHLWNGHLARYQYFRASVEWASVEWASCPLSIFSGICGMGILPVINIFGRSKPFGGRLPGYWLRR